MDKKFIIYFNENDVENFYDLLYEEHILDMFEPEKSAEILGMEVGESIVINDEWFEMGQLDPNNNKIQTVLEFNSLESRIIRVE